MSEPIFVTRPSLPPLSELLPYLEEIWRTRTLSNRGPFHEQLERELSDLFGVPHLSLMTNGMLALEGAIDAAKLTGEVITTPYSFVATSHAIARAGLSPVFADVKPGEFNIDPDRVEEAITERTSAILAVHCYGIPCDHDRLSRIAEKHGLALIYDAAHAFGVTMAGESILGWGDYSAISFHATKAFNSFEGGAVISGEASGKGAIDLWRNFGIASETSIPAVGTNAKMSEFNAAFGLVQLRHYEASRSARANIDQYYREALAEIGGLEIPPIATNVRPNFSYFPIVVRDEYGRSREQLYDLLKQREIYSRRYFFPSLSTLPPYADLPSAAAANLPNGNDMANRVLCLPIYPDLSRDDQNRLVDALRRGNVA